MSSLLEPRDEEELHKTRLLNVEEKPFKRITKRLLTPGSLLTTPSKLPTPPPDSEETAIQDEQQKQLAERQQFHEDILLDFAAFDSSISRIQFLQNSNERERERYKADKQRILDTAQAVRDNTAQLRIQLEEAQNMLEQRKKFDELTEKIYSNKMLRPREDQAIQLQKLEDDCRELERESASYGETWKERREQFGRIVEEGMQLRRLIRDEKEEVERREGMDDNGGDEDGEVGEGSRGGMTPKHSSISGNATPRPDGSSQEGLKPRPHGSGTLSRPGSRSTSRAPSPSVTEKRRLEAVSDETVTGEATADTPMAEVTESQIEAPRVTIEEPMEEDQIVLIEAGNGVEDKMDTT